MSAINKYFIEKTNLANSGDETAIKELHNAYDNECDLKQKFTKDQIQFYETGASNNKPYSTCYLAYMFFKGLGVKQDLAKAFKLMEKAMELNCSQAYYWMIDLIQLVECDYDAKKLLEKAAEMGNANADNLLGSIYREVDINKSIEYFELAIANGNTNACSGLGQIYHDGANGEIDFEKAQEYYQMAPDNQHCLFNLAVMHEMGEGFPKNNKKAITLFKKSLKLGNIRAAVSLGAYYREIGDEGLAIEYYNKAADMNDPLGCYNLAVIHKSNDELKIAAQLFIKAAKQNHLLSINLLSQFGLTANSTDEDIDEMISMKQMFGHFGAYDGW